MPQKKMTEELKGAWGEKMRLAREAKASTESKKTAPELPKEDKVPEPTTSYSDGDIAELIRQVQELKAQNRNFTQPQSTLATNNGRLVGTVEKYVVDPANYPNPTERLSASLYEVVGSGTLSSLGSSGAVFLDSRARRIFSPQAPFNSSVIFFCGICFS